MILIDLCLFFFGGEKQWKIRVNKFIFLKHHQNVGCEKKTCFLFRKKLSCWRIEKDSKRKIWMDVYVCKFETESMLLCIR